MSTLVQRDRPPKLRTWMFGSKPSQAYDPPTYSREQIAAKARILHWKFTTCKDLEVGRDNKFVRYMIQWWGMMF